MKTNVDFVGGFSTLWSALPNSATIGTVLAAIGVLIVIITVLPWLWQRRKGGLQGMNGFPWIAVVIAGICAGPQVVFPILLGLLGLVVNLLVAAAQFTIGLF